MATSFSCIKEDLSISLKKLVNGTDIRGIAIETKEHKANLTPEIVALIGSGFFKWLRSIGDNKNNLKVAIGMDSRLSGSILKAALIDALIKEGVIVFDCGMTTTPSMFMTTILEDYKCDGAIMITASHLPYYYNGLKFFTSIGGCEKEDINRIIDFSMNDESSSKNLSGEVKRFSLVDDYSKVLVDKVREAVGSEKPLEGAKIIVDAGNGAGGFFATKVLKNLGADIEGSQFLNPDGNFPNHIPNPENKEAMESIRNAVLKCKADLGIIFDTDVDRAAIVSKSGEEINKNALIALISSIIINEKNGATIVTDSITSTGLSEFITNLGGIHRRFKRGYKNVINEAKRLNAEGIECPLAIETSGHAALKENYFLDDGAYLIVKILIEMSKLKKEGKDIDYLIKDLKHPKESREIRIKIADEDFKAYGQSVIDNLKEFSHKVEGWNIEPQNYEGIKINCTKEEGWFLLRLSLHEPLLALNIESDIEGGVEDILKTLNSFLSNYNGLNTKL
ncbi:phosphomannomutase/phosphoglucomutase [Clostridium sp. YIM B02505]|uniref:Phosphomannomutase/phosphoglucomutase n=1 Tax=Clostridium yunnanense TaxID=2800325 RepID=A0ABS1EK49_9CLOT|nr:phosphomannomutase/phosphoglucomutase [Clostridium yunnanense]MBK1809730.1 phosphomannomutase/phosphoglucomutase [Clostridium yunnanense]